MGGEAAVMGFLADEMQRFADNVLDFWPRRDDELIVWSAGIGT